MQISTQFEFPTIISSFSKYPVTSLDMSLKSMGKEHVFPFHKDSICKSKNYNVIQLSKAVTILRLLSILFILNQLHKTNLSHCQYSAKKEVENYQNSFLKNLKQIKSNLKEILSKLQ